MTAEFTDFSTAVPAASVTAFAPPGDARAAASGTMPDLVAFLSRFSAVLPPATLAGLPRNGRRRPDGAVGLYGRGVTELGRDPDPAQPGGRGTAAARHRAGDRRHPSGSGPVGRAGRPPAEPGRRHARHGLAAHRHRHRGDADRGSRRAAAYRTSGVMIRTRGLTKRFGSLTAVDDVDLDVREGDVYGFLGANGSGKTTTVRMLLGLVLATSGTVELLGRPMPRQRPRRAAAGGRAGRGSGGVRAPVRARQPAPARRERARDAVARARRRRRVDEALEQVGLGGVGSPAGQGLLARDAAAARAGRRPAAPAAAAGARRAHQRPGPAGHPRDPRAAARAERGRHDDLPVQPPARRGRAAVHPGRGPRPRPAGAAGASWPRCRRPPAARCVRTPDVGVGRRAARRPAWRRATATAC